jgi:hypothetical protein
VGAQRACSRPAQVVQVLARHEGDHGVLAFEVAVDQAHADLRLGADVVHGRRMEAPPGEADHRRPEDLAAPVFGVVGHRRGLDVCFHVNEYSFTW